MKDMKDMKKGRAALILAMGMPKDKEMSEEEPEHSDKEMAVHEMMEALEENDIKGVSEALEAFVKMCQSEY